MSDECIICKASLEYLEKDEEMECAICHKKENSKTRCVKGHYVCNDCHTKSVYRKQVPIRSKGRVRFYL